MPQCKLLLCIRGDTPGRVLTWEYMPSGLLLSLKKSEALFVILHLLHTFAMSAAELARCACKLLPGCASSGFSPRAMWPSCKTMHHIMTCMRQFLFCAWHPAAVYPFQDFRSMTSHNEWPMTLLRIVRAQIRCLCKVQCCIKASFRSLPVRTQAELQDRHCCAAEHSGCPLRLP